jgi:Mn-dependent DtxR family transcriptional regulator
MPKLPSNRSLTPRQEQILRQFYLAIWEDGKNVSADSIARKLGITPAGVHKTINRLIRGGYLRRTRQKYRRFGLGLQGYEHFGISRQDILARR